MATQRETQRISVEEWRDLERMSHDTKHEYIDGQIYAMSRGSLAHGRIRGNAVRAIEDALVARKEPCFVYNSDVAARLSSRCYTYPDVLVTCDDSDRASTYKTEIRSPQVIIEVLSDSTEAYDRGRKFGLYRACPTVQEYVLIATNYRAVEMYRRTPRGWTNYYSYGLGDEVELASLCIHFPVNVLYKDAGVPEASNNFEEKYRERKYHSLFFNPYLKDGQFIQIDPHSQIH